MVRRAAGGTPTQQDRRWVWWLLALVIAAACGSTPDKPPPSGSTAVSNGGAFQLRPVVEVVPRSAAAWDQTELTCADRGEGLRDCVGAALEAPRIVLLGPAGDKYVLGPRIVDAGDVENAAAHPDAPPSSGWSVSVNLTADGTAALRDRDGDHHRLADRDRRRRPDRVGTHRAGADHERGRGRDERAHRARSEVAGLAARRRVSGPTRGSRTPAPRGPTSASPARAGPAPTPSSGGPSSARTPRRPSAIGPSRDRRARA